MNTTKEQRILRIERKAVLPSGWLHLVLVDPDGAPMFNAEPGQFVEVAVDRANVLLNRPLSIYNRTERSLELLVSPVGTATRALEEYAEGDSLRVIGALGKGFGIPSGKVLLVGGGVGIAPLYYQMRRLLEKGCEVEVLFGMRTAPDDAVCRRFSELAPLHVCTDDGSTGFHGLVTAHPVFTAGNYSMIQMCGPKPMMKAAAALAAAAGIEAEASLENMMACGLGACLCCVEPTVKGNLCVCKHGPVFNIKELQW